LGGTDAEKRLYLLITRSTVQFNPASDHSLDVANFLAAVENIHFLFSPSLDFVK
jgi:hypothetical protein